MSDEIKEEVKEECKCFCKSEGVKKFVVVALGTFVGAYAALSLFAATHRPPMPPCPFGGGPCMRPPIHHMQHFYKGKGDIHRVKFEKRAMKDHPFSTDEKKIED